LAITIRRPVTVKAIVTVGLKENLVRELQQAVAQVDLELKHLEFQGKKLLSDFSNQGREAVEALQQRLESERQQRLQAKQELLQKIQAVAALELGEEVVHSTVEADWTVEIGQSWSQIQGAEIVLKDDIVVEIREAGRLTKEG
jgi:F0F1-type ATP synthase membrane subunit b/b'